jgi:hypothetical protein
MKRKSCCLLVLIFLVAVSFAAALLNPASSYAKSKKVRQRTATIMGVLEKEGTDYVIRSGNTKYAVSGHDLDELLGKKVKATGTRVKGERGRVLEVSRIQVVKSRR